MDLLLPPLLLLLLLLLGFVSTFCDDAEHDVSCGVSYGDGHDVLIYCVRSLLHELSKMFLINPFVVAAVALLLGLSVLVNF